MDKAHITVERYSGSFAEPRQFYETTLIIDIDGFEIPVTIGSVPARAFDERNRAEVGNLEGLVGVIGGELDNAVVLRTVAQLTTAVGLMIDPRLRTQGPRERHPVWEQFKSLSAEPFFYRTPPWWRHPGQQGASPIPAAEYLVFSASIPAEKSDLSGHTLAKIVTGSGGTALVAAVFAGAATPWLLIAVPAGVIVMKVADGAGDALSDVVKYKILKRLAPELLDQKSEKS